MEEVISFSHEVVRIQLRARFGIRGHKTRTTNIEPARRTNASPMPADWFLGEAEWISATYLDGIRSELRYLGIGINDLSPLMRAELSSPYVDDEDEVDWGGSWADMEDGSLYLQHHDGASLSMEGIRLVVRTMSPEEQATVVLGGLRALHRRWVIERADEAWEVDEMRASAFLPFELLVWRVVRERMLMRVFADSERCGLGGLALAIVGGPAASGHFPFVERAYVEGTRLLFARNHVNDTASLCGLVHRSGEVCDYLPSSVSLAFARFPGLAKEVAGHLIASEPSLLDRQRRVAHIRPSGLGTGRPADRGERCVRGRRARGGTALAKA